MHSVVSKLVNFSLLATTIICLSCVGSGSKGHDGDGDLIEDDDGAYNVKIVYGTDREKESGSSSLQYGSVRRVVNGYDMGIVNVSIPEDHEVGEIEKPSFWQFWEDSNDTTKYMVVTSIKQEKFAAIELLRKLVSNSSNRDIFIFIHGFNVTFKDAALRTAQLAFDIGFNGCPTMYSWPSSGKLVDYTYDLESVKFSIPNLKDFILTLIAEGQPEKINLIAHSMGTDLLSQVLLAIRTENPEIHFNQIILAAPDIDAAIFKRDIAPKITQSGNQITIYSTSNDKALIASKKLRKGYKRLGDTDSGIEVINGIYNVDVSALTEDDYFSTNHSYCFESRPVVNDIFTLINNGSIPSQRNLVEVSNSTGLFYRFRR